MDKVRKAKAAILQNKSYSFKLNEFLSENGELSEHALIGRKIEKITGKKNVGTVHTIINVYVNYQKGYYLTLRIKEDSSEKEGLVYWENINSTSKFIKASIRSFKSLYKLIENEAK